MIDKRKNMTKEMKFEVNMANLWDRIKGPSVIGSFLPKTQARRPASHFN